MVGTIRNMREDKGYAFIVSGNDRDIFLHKEQFHGDWNELIELHRKGPVEVEFEIMEAPKGLRAITCKLGVK